MKSKIVLLLLTNVCVVFSQFNFKVRFTPEVPKFNKIVILHNSSETLKSGISGINSSIINGEIKNETNYKCDLNPTNSYTLFFLDTVRNKTNEYAKYVVKYKVKSGNILKIEKNEATPYKRDVNKTNNNSSTPSMYCFSCYNAHISIYNNTNSIIYDYGYKCNKDYTWSNMLSAEKNVVVNPKSIFDEDLNNFCNGDNVLDSVNFKFKTNTEGVFKEILVKNVKPYKVPQFIFNTDNGQLNVKVEYLSNAGVTDANRNFRGETELATYAPQTEVKEPEPIQENKIELIVDKPAVPLIDIKTYLMDKYDPELRKKLEELNGKLHIRFTIEKTGVASDFKVFDIKKVDIKDITTGSTYGFVNELKKLLKEFIKTNSWTPANFKGKTVRSIYKFDFSFLK